MIVESGCLVRSCYLCDHFGKESQKWSTVSRKDKFILGRYRCHLNTCIMSKCCTQRHIHTLWNEEDKQFVSVNLWTYPIIHVKLQIHKHKITDRNMQNFPTVYFQVHYKIWQHSKFHVILSPKGCARVCKFWNIWSDYVLNYIICLS